MADVRRAEARPAFGLLSPAMRPRELPIAPLLSVFALPAREAPPRAVEHLNRADVPHMPSPVPLSRDTPRVPANVGGPLEALRQLELEYNIRNPELCRAPVAAARLAYQQPYAYSQKEKEHGPYVFNLANSPTGKPRILRPNREYYDHTRGYYTHHYPDLVPTTAGATPETRTRLADSPRPHPIEAPIPHPSASSSDAGEDFTGMEQQMDQGRHAPISPDEQFRSNAGPENFSDDPSPLMDAHRLITLTTPVLASTPRGKERDNILDDVNLRVPHRPVAENIFHVREDCHREPYTTEAGERAREDHGREDQREASNDAAVLQNRVAYLEFILEETCRESKDALQRAHQSIRNLSKKLKETEEDLRQVCAGEKTILEQKKSVQNELNKTNHRHSRLEDEKQAQEEELNAAREELNHTQEKLRSSISEKDELLKHLKVLKVGQTRESGVEAITKLESAVKQSKSAWESAAGWRARSQAIEEEKIRLQERYKKQTKISTDAQMQAVKLAEEHKRLLMAYQQRTRESTGVLQKFAAFDSLKREFLDAIDLVEIFASNGDARVLDPLFQL